MACMRGDRAQGRRLRHLASRDAALAALQEVEGQGEGDAVRHPQLRRRPHGRSARADAPGRRHRRSTPGRGCFGICGSTPACSGRSASPGSSSSCRDFTRGTRTTARFCAPTRRAPPRLQRPPRARRSAARPRRPALRPPQDRRRPKSAGATAPAPRCRARNSAAAR